MDDTQVVADTVTITLTRADAESLKRDWADNARTTDSMLADDEWPTFKGEYAEAINRRYHRLFAAVEDLV